MTDEIESQAEEYKQHIGLSDRDALHLACAVIGKADVILTCDDKFLSKATKLSIPGAVIENPLSFSDKL